MAHPDTIVVGDRELVPTTENIAHLRELRSLYKGRNYMLDVQEGKPVIYLRKGCTAEDRLLATMQGIYLERLRESEAYRDLLAGKGAREADTWLLEESLRKTPLSPGPLLQEMKKAGWSVDILKSCDGGVRATWGGGPGEESLQYELPIPEPPVRHPAPGD